MQTSRGRLGEFRRGGGGGRSYSHSRNRDDPNQSNSRESNNYTRDKSESQHQFDTRTSRHRRERDDRSDRNYPGGYNSKGRDYKHQKYHSDDYERNPKRTRQMGFKYVQELLSNNDMEAVVFTLSNNRKGFKELLEDRDMKNDMIVSIVKLLIKICDCSFSNTKIHFFQVALNSGFIDNLTKYISTLALQGDREKKFNSYFWNDPNEFWNNVIDISRNVTDIIPTTSCESILKTLKAMKLSIPIIEHHQSIHVSDEIKTSIESLFDTVQNIASETERKRQLDEIIVVPNELEPPDNFRDINVYPSALEVTNPESPFLRPNVVRGPYRDINHYLDVQFRLLREDFVSPLRKGICKYIKNPKDKLDDIRIYSPVRFLCMETVNEQNCYRIQYDFSKKKKTFNYENSKRFIFGSLLCFTSDHFNTVIFGKIVQREVKDLEKGHLVVGFNEEVKLPENLASENYLMVESKIYFEPYYHVLNVLKNMKLHQFPMERYIIRVETETRPPDYLLQIDPTFYEIENHTFWPLNWGDRRFYSLNDEQHLAFKAALTEEFSIIQGPPGTGKTFLGLKIARTLLENKSAWYKRTPMLVICYTNHALDQFLEGLLEVTNDILRVGNRSKNDILNKFNIKAKRHLVTNQAVAQKRHEVRCCIQQITAIDETLTQIDLNESIVDFRVFSDVIPHYKESWFYNAKKKDILKWLLENAENLRQPAPGNRDRFQVTKDAENSNIIGDDVDDVLEEESLELDDEREMFDDILENITATVSQPIISIKDLRNKITLLNQELNGLEINNNLQNLLQEENINFELYKTQRDLYYLEMRLNEGARSVRKIPRFVDLQNPNHMPAVSRWQLYWCWLEQYKLVLLKEREDMSKIFRKIFKVYNELRDMEDTQVMKDSLVVGMTTTGAARLQASLQALRSPIVIVEEAAEVLEAHIISSLTNYCEHLILIGDHQQLKPSTANYAIETKYLLGISLFERMVLNKIQCHMLNIQHRMRPEISSLVHPSIYPRLEDHKSVMNRPPIQGVENCLYFIDHKESEQLCNDNSKKNVHEAKFLINFAKHLILNGYKPENITILAAYLGQMFEMQRQKKLHNLILQDVRIAVLDNYQGEESDIVLLSLVRSNTENKIGFLKNENRVCVALSRARDGFYMIGNMKQLCDNSDIWPKVRETLENQNAIGPYLSLRCQVHRHKVTQVQSGDDFMDIPEGGCNLMCEKQIACGHICKKICHTDDREHSSYKCREKCNRVLCDTPEHLCLKLCYEDCGLCTYPVERNLDCGHTVTIDCQIDPVTYNCNILVKTTLSCGHEADKPCHIKPESFRCPHPCDVRVEPCGHACTRLCHINADPDHLVYKCRKPCAKPKIGCSLPNDEKHICSKFCFEECDECDVVVKKHRTVCSHVYSVCCKMNVDDIDCIKPCTKILPCKHKCRNVCNEPCGKCNVQVEKVVPDCNHKVKLLCYQNPERQFCRGKCPRLLVCGHECGKKCYETCTSCKVKVACSIPSPCGHVIKNIECSLKNSVEPEILLKYCSEKCKTKLKCGHTCLGTCGECVQGRFHQRCKEKCGVPLICNHECPIPCQQACKPCQKKCEYRCSHSKCNRKCGDPCNKCTEPCTRTCKHRRCNKKCDDICDIPPCYEPCKKHLKCGHPCVGFCGDPCPTLCRVCDKEKLTQIFLGNEDDEQAIYVMLEDCKHIFESSDLEQWLNIEDNAVKAKVCPMCKTAITKTKRYSEYIKKSLSDISNVNKKAYGTPQENILLRNLLLNEIDTKLKLKELFKGINELYSSTLVTLKEKLQESVKVKDQWRRQFLNRLDLMAIQAKLRVIDFMTEVYGEKKFKDTTNTDKSAIQISFLLKALMHNDHISDQEIEDITMEIKRLSRIVQFENIQKSDNFRYALTKDNIVVKEQKISSILVSQKRYTQDIDDALQTDLTELNKLVDSSISITEVERKQIVSALGLSKGHWFKCPNGHYYVITECGGANQISKCNECGINIGGQNHRLLPGQQFAPEMDNSLHPAWSEAANLANYQI